MQGFAWLKNLLRPLVLLVGLGCACAGVAAPPNTGRWQQIFRDDFRGFSLRDDRWTDTTRVGSTSYRSFTAAATTYAVTAGEPALTKRRLRFFADPRTAQDGVPSVNFSGGPIHTRTTLRLQYGYVELRVRLPRGDYDCTAELLPVEANDPSRLTIFTTRGMAAGQLRGEVTINATPSQAVMLGNPDTDFAAAEHLIGVEWTPGAVVWYLDGTACGRVEHAPQGKMYLQLSFAMARQPVDAKDPLLTKAARLEIGDVRVFHKEGEVDTAPPTVYATHLTTHRSYERGETTTTTTADGGVESTTAFIEHHEVRAIQLVFDEPLEKAGAEDVTHYQVDRTRVTRATLDRNRRTVTLSVEKIDRDGLALLHISGVTDLAGNAVTGATVKIGPTAFLFD